MLPAAEGYVLVIALLTIHPSLHELSCRQITMIVAANGIVDALFLAIIQPDSNFFHPVLILIILIHQAHTVTISVPSHAEVPRPHLPQHKFTTTALIIAVNVSATPTVKILLGMLQESTGDELFQMLGAHVFAATICFLDLPRGYVGGLLYLLALILDILILQALHLDSCGCTVDSP